MARKKPTEVNGTNDTMTVTAPGLADGVASLEIGPGTAPTDLKAKALESAIKHGRSVKITDAPQADPEAAVEPETVPAMKHFREHGKGNRKYEIFAQRLTPIAKRDIAVPKRLDLMGIKTWLGAEHGGGEYLLQISFDGAPLPAFDGEQVVIVAGAPKDVEDVEGDEDDPVVDTKKRTNLLKAEKARIEAEAEVEATKRRAAKMIKSADTDEDSEVVKLRRELEEVKAKPASDPIDAIVKLTPLLTPLFALFKPDNSGVAEAIKESARLQTDMQKDMMRAFEKQQERAEQQQEKMLTTIKEMVEKKVVGSSPVDEYFKMEDRMLGRLQKLGIVNREDEEREPLRINPDSPIMSILGHFAERGLNALFTALESGSPAMEQLATNILARMNQPRAQLTAGNPTDEAALAAALQQEMIARQRPQPQLPPAPQQRAPRPAPPGLQQPPRRNVVPMKPPALPTPAPAIQTPPPVEAPAPNSLNETPPTTEVPATPEAELSNLLEEDIDAELVAIVDTMAQDIISGRVMNSQFRWIEQAVANWPWQFADQIVASVNHLAAMQMIKERIGKARWSIVDEALVKVANEADAKKAGDGQYVWNNFHNSFAALQLALKEDRALAEQEAAAKSEPAATPGGAT